MILKKLFLYLLWALLLCPFISFGQSGYEQIMNSGFEEFENLTTNEIEPLHWNSFMTATTSGLGSLGKAKRLNRSTDVRPGSTGNYSVEIYSTSVIGIIANGNLTTGRIHMGSTTPAHVDNYNYTDTTNANHHHPFTSLPDSMVVWVKFTPKGTGSSTAAATIYIHNNRRFIAPSIGTPRPDQIVAEVLMQITENQNSNVWHRLSYPFNYDGNPTYSSPTFGSTTPTYILANFTTNKTPGSGASNDQLFIDDIELIYNKQLVTGNPDKTEYFKGENINIPFTITGAMYADNTVTAQLSDANGSFTNPVILGSTSTGFIHGTHNLLVEGKLPQDIMPSNGYRVRVVSSHYELTAEACSNLIKIYEPAYTITASAGEGGVIEPDGIVGVMEGDSKTFSFIPDLCYHISQVLVDGIPNETALANGFYTFNNISTNHTISVSFERSGYLIVASANEGGKIIPEGAIVVETGNNQTFEAVPNNGYKIEKFVVDGVNITNIMQYEFNNVIADHQISVIFIPQANINEHSFSKINIYPNPVLNKIFVNSETTIHTLAIYDITGRLLIQQAPNKCSADLSINTLSPGIYFIKINEVTRKLIKN